jgi:3'(2'), 5'-bisphosphate nucleotidase
MSSDTALLSEKTVAEVTRSVLEAGRHILEIYSGEPDVSYKADSTPLTDADLASNAVLTGALKAYYPVLSEEGAEIPYETRRGWKRFWLVDPLDGTKEFIKRNGEFTVNVALIEDNRPVAGWVYLPVQDVLYLGIAGEGAWKTENACKKGRKTALPAEGRSGRVRVVASRSHMNAETEEFIRDLERTSGPVELVTAGSSLKFCMVAEGSADIYPRFGPTMEWDTAAADAVCRAAGARVVKAADSLPLEYNKENLQNPFFIVEGKHLSRYLIEHGYGY